MKNLSSIAALMQSVNRDQQTVESLPVDKVQPDPDQPRLSIDAKSETFKALVASIKAQGVIQPILVRPPDAQGIHVIVAGERRWRASVVAGSASIPVIVREIGEDDVRAIQLIENLHREDLPPLEEAAAIAKLVKQAGGKKGVVAKAIGKSNAYVSLRLGLLKLPDTIKNLHDARVTQDAETLNLLGALHALDAPRALGFIDDPETISRGALREAVRVAKTPATPAADVVSLVQGEGPDLLPIPGRGVKPMRGVADPLSGSDPRAGQGGVPTRPGVGEARAEKFSHAKKPGRAVSVEVDGKVGVLRLDAGLHEHSVYVEYADGETQMVNCRDTLIRVLRVIA